MILITCYHCHRLAEYVAGNGVWLETEGTVKDLCSPCNAIEERKERELELNDFRTSHSRQSRISRISDEEWDYRNN